MAVTLRRAAITTVGALVLAGLLNAGTLDQHAQRLPFGWKHDAAAAVTSRLSSLSHTLWLDRPRLAVDDLLGRDHDSPPAAIVPVPVPSSTPGPTPTPTPGATPSTRPSPTPTAPAVTKDNPLRVFVAGDSVSHEFGEELVKLTERGDGMLTARAEFRYSSGLTRPDYYDWRGRLRAVLDGSRPPRAMVVLFGANDAQGIMTSSGAAAFGSAAWIAEYRGRVAAAMDEMLARGARVYWVGQPIMRPSRYDERMVLLNGIYAEEAAKRPQVMFISTRSLFADDDGHYSAYLRDGSGARVLMRAPDGIHLSAAGGRRMAQLVLDRIRDDWSIR